jgi:hypothetical protein
VDLALASGKIYEGEGFKYIRQSFDDGTLHLIGLLSDGGVHSRFDQLQVTLPLPLAPADRFQTSPNWSRQIADGYRLPPCFFFWGALAAAPERG